MKILLKQDPALTAIGLLSILATALLAFRITYTESLTFAFLAWNLFLAWIPLGLSLALRPGLLRSSLATTAILGAWLLFFPNAPYILTDLVHLKPRVGIPYWYDLVLIATFAFAGLLAGWESLRRVHVALLRRIRPGYAWTVIGAASLLAGVGVYIGRVLRWNSWDILRDPMAILSDVAAPVLHPRENSQMLGVSLVFGGFLFVGYIVMRIMVKPVPHEN